MPRLELIQMRDELYNKYVKDKYEYEENQFYTYSRDVGFDSKKIEESECTTNIVEQFEDVFTNIILELGREKPVDKIEYHLSISPFATRRNWENSDDINREKFSYFYYDKKVQKQYLQKMKEMIEKGKNEKTILENYYLAYFSKVRLYYSNEESEFIKQTPIVGIINLNKLITKINGLGYNITTDYKPFTVENIYDRGLDKIFLEIGCSFVDKNVSVDKEVSERKLLSKVKFPNFKNFKF